jgi:Chitobiase/beta-hexosaminidase C-terminal domain/Fibronectin type III domain
VRAFGAGLAGLILVAGGPALSSHAAGPDGAAYRLLPPDGSKLIVQPASVGLVAATELRSADFTVTDGCGRELALGRSSVLGAAAAVPLPAQNAGPGSWVVSWTVRDAKNAVRSGVWSFSIDQGGSCTADGVVLAASGGHHDGQQQAARPATGAASVAGLTPRPAFAFWLGLLAAALMVAAGASAVAAQRRTKTPVVVRDVVTAVVVLAAALTFSAAAEGDSLFARAWTAVPAAVLIACGTLAVIGQVRHRLARVLVGTMFATTMTAAVAGVWGAGRLQLLAIPGDEAFASLAWQVVSAAAVVSVLLAGGWFATTDGDSSKSSGTPPFRGTRTAALEAISPLNWFNRQSHHPLQMRLLVAIRGVAMRISTQVREHRWLHGAQGWTTGAFSRLSRSARFRHSERVAVAGLASMAVVAALVITPAQQASAAVPEFPNNIVVFPNRDFVSVEGYEDRAGETATMEVTRPGVGIIGSAEAEVDGGGVAFEINHPGGACWGAGTGLNVTPDIQPGDVVSMRFGNEPAGDVRVIDGFVTVGGVQNGATVVIDGHIGAGVNKDFAEQRIVEPALRDLVGKRDVRAIPGPLTPAPQGGYSSALEFPTATTFQATYVFTDPDGQGPLTAADVAEVAANPSLGERLLTWEETDLVGNRQGITIAEFGEPGGPGFGGCPNGPLQSGPPGPTDVAAVVTNGSIRLNWTPAVAIPGTPAITGYRVHAVADTVSPNGEQVEIGKRIAGQAAKGTTISGLATGETYTVRVVSTSSVGETFPAVVASPVTDGIPPTVAASPNGGSFATPRSVTLTANEPGADIYYTIDGTEPLVGGDVLDPAALPYNGPFTISADATVKFVAFDLAGNVSQTGEAVFTITNTPTPDAPVFSPATVGATSIDLSWTANDPSITGYGVQLYEGATASGALRETDAATTTMSITDLTPGTDYFVTVKAQNANGYGPESAKLGPLTPVGAVVAVAGPDQTITRQTTPTTVNLTGAGSTTTDGVSYQWVQVAEAGSTGADLVTLDNPTTLTPSFSLPLFTAAQTNVQKRFRLTVTLGATTKTSDVLVKLVPDRVAIGSARWKARDFRVTGTGTVVGATITLHSGSPTGPVLGQPVLTTAAAAPATGAVFEFRLRNGAAPAANPGRVYIDSSVGGTAGPFTVS